MVETGWDVILCACLAAAFAGGCGASDSNQKPCFPVAGQLFVGGKPAAGAMLFFQPQDGSRPEDWTHGFPRATVQADGSFAVETYGTSDGAPAGEYVVLARWSAASSEEGDEQAAPDRLAGKYMQASSSPLKATVEPKATTLPRYDLP